MRKGRHSEPGDSGRSSREFLAIVLDENIAGEELRDALAATAAAHGARIELITEHFERGTLDEVWLPVAAKRGWAVVTCDARVKRRPAEKDILLRAGVCVFILRGAMNGDQIREALRIAIPAICRRHRQLSPPVICHVTREGQVVIVVGDRRGGIRR
jgi:hypothetical protein